MGKLFRRIKLSEIGRIVAGGTPKTKIEEYWNGEVSWITPKDLSSHSCVYISRGNRNISREGLDNSSAKLLPRGTVLFTSRAPIGYVAIAENEVTTNQGFKSIIVNDRNDNKFVYYLLKNNVNVIENYASGSTFKEISGTVMKNLEFDIPSLMEQKSIAKILSSIDEKIEINNKISQTLESIAQSIFQHWFVDFEFPNENGEPYKSSGGEMVESELGMIPKGWTVSTLGESVSITMGQSPSGKSYNEESDGMVFYQGRTDFNDRFPKRRLFTTEPKRLAKKNDVLMSVRAPVGDINVANEDCCIGRGLCALRMDESENSYLLYLMLNLEKELGIYNGEGTVFGSINQKALKAIKFVLPPREYILKYESIVNSFDKKYYYQEMESRRLTELRDTLLPKLMSGEIRVPLSEEEAV